MVCDGFEFLGMNCYATDIHIIQIPPEVWCFRYVFLGGPTTFSGAVWMSTDGSFFGNRTGNDW